MGDRRHFFDPDFARLLVHQDEVHEGAADVDSDPIFRLHSFHKHFRAKPR